MIFREKFPEERQLSGGSGPPPPGGEELEALNREARAYYDAADQAIARALSRDSEEFLRASRQTGGQ